MTERSTRRGSTGSSDPPRAADERGATAVLGFVLITGMVLVASVGVLLVGGTLLEAGAKDAETERAEMSMVELGRTIDSVAVSSDETRTVDLSLPSDTDGVIRREDTGRFVVTRYNGTSEEVINRSFGSIVYRNDGTTFAYEAGGVWAGTGRGASMVSGPELTYRDDTLTLPIADVSGATQVSSGRLGVTKQATTAPLNDVQMVRGELITLRITSPYYAGWAEYFRQTIDGVTVDVDHANRTTVVHLADPNIDGGFDTGIVASGDVDATNPSQTPSTEVRTSGTFDGDVTCDAGSGSDCVETVDSVDLTTLDAAIEVRAMSARKDPDVNTPTLTGGETLTAGTYYLDDDTYLMDDGDLTFDLGTGNITVISDGNVALKKGTIRVVNATGDYSVRVYMNHTDVAIGNKGGVYVEDGDPARFQLYGTSDTLFAMGQANTHGYTGTIYAPRETPDGGTNDAADDNDMSNVVCSADVCFGKGSGDVTGAVVAGDVSIGQNTNFTYADSLQDVEPTMDKGGLFPPPITYLHVAVHEVELEKED